MSRMSQEQINADLFDEVKKLQTENKALKGSGDGLLKIGIELRDECAAVGSPANGFF